MYQITTASLLTWTVSYLSSSLIKNSINSISNTKWLKAGDQICRGGILSFVLTQVLPHNLEHFGVFYTAFASLCILTGLYGIEYSYQYTCKHSVMQNKAWFTYVLLIPHCILEGFAAAPYFIGEYFNPIYICLFFWHKISELAMITLSTELHLKKSREQYYIQQLFILLTPAAMLLGSYLHVDSQFISHDMHGILELINMNIFLHIALFCQFCSCKDECKEKSSMNIDKNFIAAFVIIGLIFLSMPTAHHHCTHSHSHAHCHKHK